MESHKHTIKYYEDTEWQYRLLWDLDHSLAMHAGYWDSETTNLREALQRQNAVIAEMAHIQREDRVLDAGCGYGGSSIYLAKEIGCDVVGVNICQRQIGRAREEAQRRILHERRPEFIEADFSHTPFPDASFSVVWAIESTCHARSKPDFLKEVYRLLKPGGRLIIADAMATKSDYSPEELKEVDKWIRGFGVKYADTILQFRRYLEDAQFEQINFTDVTPHVLPSSKKLYQYSHPGVFLSKMLSKVRIPQPSYMAKFSAARGQYLSLKRGLWVYCIIQAKKKV